MFWELQKEVVRFCGEYRLLSSLVNVHPPAGTFRYEQYEKAFDAHWDEIKALPDSVSIEVSGSSAKHEVYKEFKANEEYKHFFDLVKIKLTSRYGENIEETIRTNPFAILNEKGQRVDCKVTHKKAVKADEAFVRDVVQQVMERVNALCKLYKPGYIPGEKEC